MWRILLLFILIFTVALNVRAQNIENELEEIGQQANKAMAIVKLSQLLESEKLNKTQRIRILIQQSNAYFTLSNLQKALEIIQQAKALLDENSLSQLQADVDKLMGIILYFQGEYAQSLVAYEAALNYFQQQVFSAEKAIKQAHLLNNIALVQTSKGDSLAALKAYKEADELYQYYGSEVDKIDVRYNLAVLYLSLRRYDIAINMFEEVISKREVLNDEHGIAKASAGIGVSYKQSGQYQKAESYVMKALTYFRNNDYHIDAASQFHNLAEINYELSNLDKASEYANLGVELSKKIGHQMTYGGSLHTLAKIYFYQGDIERSHMYLDLSNAVAKKMGFQQLINGNLGLSALLYAADGETAKALMTQLAYQKERLKLSNETLNEQIAQFESVQLSQQVKSLQQSKKLQELESTKADQQREFIILIFAFLLTVLFLIYRRYLERRLTKKLENRVKQRTEALEFLTKELQDASMVKSQFLANMSHEIRTPLTAVLGQAEAIIHGDFDNEDLLHEVEVIHNNSLHLLQLINDILDLSKIEANKFELENRRQDLHTIVDKLNDMFTEQAQRKNLSFTVSHHLPTPFIIDIDGLRLKQILINLCSNAIKFTKEGWVSLDIAIIDKTLLFTVTDTGIGMNKKQMAKMFNIFTQGDNSISRRFSGSGLGLFLSDQLAKVMSGKITVTSQLNQGSTFVLKLPFGEVYSVLDGVENNEQALGIRVNKKQYTGKILLADDHDDNRRLIARLLTNLGLEVLEASNGIEAVELCNEHKPIITLLDIQMPRMDGIQALEALREKGCDRPIYALTANAMAHEIAQYLALGFAGHLKKPIEREVFIATIAQHYPEKASIDKNNVEKGNIGSANFEANVLLEQKVDDIDISDITKSFINNLSQDKQELIDYRHNNEYKALAKLAHKISGAAQMFGFIEISQSAMELESAIKKQKLEIVDDLTHCLIDEINLVLSNSHKDKDKDKDKD
ncbi:ATP-binding protein [Colwellia sp. 4_MG-2023]|uniref:ATP-binding protein n=1 Tax=unclassified Colwellia TaxID=196834 RepID=UPI0026E160DB|nr:MULTISPECIES: ATP-binding protein [unclassified Colwellia]MDO6507163.1 ATP-binding protein [Colwellia sp. 5_MG-2023]MDO6555999.1 ATP-binding protein [Colwellia sp. 4_MG-2023]